MTTDGFVLTEQERRALAHEVDDGLEILALPVPRSSAALVRRLAAQVRSEALGADEVAALLEHVGHLPQPETTTALARMEQRWRDLESRHGLLTGPQVADLAGSRATNRSELASSLARQGRVVAVKRGGRARYPGFQFTEHGKPYPVVQQVLAMLRGAGWADESFALWFDAPNGHLDDRRPADLVASDPGAVLRVAGHAAARSDW